MDQYTEKIARLLRTDKHTLEKTAQYMSALTGKEGIYEKIVQRNSELINERLLALGVSKNASSNEVYDALISKIESDDFKIYKSLGTPNCASHEGCNSIARIAKKAVEPPVGFFLKLEKARELVVNIPPQNIMKFLGYTSAKEMVEKEDILEIFSALRFVEGAEWLNSVFFKQYESLTPEDFEEREIQIIALSEKWDEVAKKFVEKKRHNVSHLKELGVVFLIPALLGVSGEILRMFVMIMHYLYEIPFYSSIIKSITGYEERFSSSLISLLRGDVSEDRYGELEKSRWLIVQRYLAKEDENDWRLFVPHINPEAIHWMKAEENLYKVGEVMDGFAEDLKFWNGLGWVGDYFKDESGVEVLVSFNLIDTIMSFVKQKERVKYSYHQEEAIWNEIFIQYSGRPALEEYSRKYLLQGYFDI